MENIKMWVDFINSIFRRNTYLLLFAGNIIALLLYNMALPEVQALLIGNLPEYYRFNMLIISQILIKVNNGILNFILIGFIVWAIVELLHNRFWGGVLLQKLLNSEKVINIWLVSIKGCIIIGNVLVLFSFVLIFFFQDSLLYQTTLSFTGEPFTWQLPVGWFTWLTVGISAWYAISILNKQQNP